MWCSSLAGQWQELMGREFIIEEHEHHGPDPLVVGGALRGVVAQEGRETGSIVGGRTARRSHWRKERPRLPLAPQGAGASGWTEVQAGGRPERTTPGMAARYMLA